MDVGTGDDFKTAATSGAGRVHRFQVESLAFVVDGPEKSLDSEIRRDKNRKDRDLHPDALSNAL